MNRKNTILLAVLINAGLLLVLFISAISSQEEIATLPVTELSSHTPVQGQDCAPPLFRDEIDFAMQSSPNQPQVAQAENLPQVLPESSSFTQLEPSIVHSLPPILQEAPIAQVQVPASARLADGFQEVTVKKGDTLEKIAKMHRTTVDEIIRVNQLPSSFLRVGQILKLPGEKSIVAKAPVKSPAPEKITQSGPEYYTVKVGDNPWSIAMKHHLKVDELLKLNGLNEEKARKLKPGDRLRIR